MRTLASRFALSIGAAAALAACSQAAPPMAAPGVMPQSRAIAAETDQRSWVSHKAATSDLLYVGTLGRGLSMYTYPEGKLVGVVQNPNFSYLAGECVDGSGDVFVTNLGNNEIFEYEHGSTKLLQTLYAPTSYRGIDCAIDPTTGNLAVSLRRVRGGAAIFTYFFCGYDDKGNLFVDG